MAAYPDLLNRYLVAKIQMAVYKAPPFLLSASKPTPETLAHATTVTPNENCEKDNASNHPWRPLSGHTRSTIVTGWQCKRSWCGGDTVKTRQMQTQILSPHNLD